MKLTRKMKLLLILIPIVIFIIFMGFALANTGNSKNADLSPEYEKTSVVLEETKANEMTAFDVYLEMAKEASVGSFQIGLEVDSK